MGSWMLINVYEVVVMSGIVVVVDLGVEYLRDLERDGWVLLCFRLYYLLVYGWWYRRRSKSKMLIGEGSGWVGGLYGSVYKGLGVVDEER